QTLPGYDPDVQKNRAEARRIMQRLGYGPDNRLKIRASVRDLPYLRDPAVIMIDQLKQVYIDDELETIATTNWSIDRGRSGKTQEADMGNRAETGRGRRAPDHLLRPTRNLLAAAGQGADPHVNSLFNGWRMEDVWLDR